MSGDAADTRPREPRATSEVRAVFFDRDGVLNEVVERDGKPGSPRSVAEVSIVQGAAQALDRLRRAGFRVFAITNQPDVARGAVTPTESESIMAAVRRAVPLDDALACHHDDGDGCRCRKPLPGMIERLGARWRVDVRSSWVVGDQWRDVEAGRAAGCRTVLIRRPYNGGSEADLVVGSVDEAVTCILAEAAINASASG